MVSYELNSREHCLLYLKKEMVKQNASKTENKALFRGVPYPIQSNSPLKEF
jgi:hypothetical protein